jgi:hypothetical protein
MRRIVLNRLYTCGFLLAWVALIGVGSSRFLSYENTAGSASTPPLHWPKESRLIFAGDRPTLTLFLHPKCPCSRASVAEFSELIERNPDKFACNVVFFTPEGAAPDWSQTDLYRSAARLPGVRLFTDREGREARRFKATTSGDLVLYDASGQLRFHGGITVSRGHLGESLGRQSVQSFLSAGKPSVPETPVFGCPLSNPADCKKARLP